MKIGFSKFLFVLGLFSIASSSLAHRYYASFSQVELQPTKGTIEVIHRIFTHDIEDLLVRYQGSNGELADEVIEKFLKDYIIQAFALYAPNGQRVPLEWIAVEITLNDIYVYQEAPLRDGQQTVIVANRILHDLFDDQSNTVNVKLGRKVRSNTFNKGDPLYQISFDGRTGEYPFND